MNDQMLDVFKFVKIDNDNKWLMNDILNSRYHDKDKRLQYKVKWNKFDKNHEWYNIDKEKFNNVIDAIQKYHKKHFDKSRYWWNVTSIMSRFKNVTIIFYNNVNLVTHREKIMLRKYFDLLLHEFKHLINFWTFEFKFWIWRLTTSFYHSNFVSCFFSSQLLIF